MVQIWHRVSKTPFIFLLQVFDNFSELWNDETEPTLNYSVCSVILFFCAPWFHARSKIFNLDFTRFFNISIQFLFWVFDAKLTDAEYQLNPPNQANSAGARVFSVSALQKSKQRKRDLWKFKIWMKFEILYIQLISIKE